MTLRPGAVGCPQEAPDIPRRRARPEAVWVGVLLETHEAAQAFGTDGVFELQDLLVDTLGTNLRNEVSHGLLDDSGLFGAEVLYAWWHLLRYCVVTSKLVERKQMTAALPSPAGPSREVDTPGGAATDDATEKTPPNETNEAIDSGEDR